MSVWIVLPTYNEAENLKPLVRGVRATVPDARVLVVDDASPDGTGAVADALGGVDVLHRPAKSGLGRAYVAVRDLTGGLKCWRAEALEAIDFESVRSQGYAFQVELTYRAIRSGLRVEEVPITFHERAHGCSKMTPRIGIEAAWRLPLLRISADDHAGEGRTTRTRPRLG